ncbi:MAG: VanZ family protein [Methylococcales bacterium]
MAKLLSPAHPFIRWFCVLLWTISVISLLLKPGDNVPGHELAFSDFLTSFFFLEFNRYNFREAIVHVILFGVLTVLWQWALIRYMPRYWVLTLAFFICVVLGVGTEIGQYFVNRSSLLLDLIANLLGIVIASISFGYMVRIKIY